MIPSTSLLLILYNLWSLTSIGLLYENSCWAWPSEIIRCTTTLLIFNQLAVVFSLPAYVLQVLFTGLRRINFRLLSFYFPILVSSALSGILFFHQLMQYKGVKKE